MRDEIKGHQNGERERMIEERDKQIDMEDSVQKCKHIRNKTC